jgi:hypothetical protein
VTNTGTKKWKHIQLVHQDGLRPACSKIEVTKVKPGESTEILAQFPPLGASAPDVIKR